MNERPQLSRRQVVLGGIAIAGLAACSDPSSNSNAPDTQTRSAAGPTSDTARPGRATTQPASADSARTSWTTLSTPATATSAAAVTAAPSGTLPPAAAAGQPAIFVDHGPRTGTAVSLTYHASGDPALTTALLDVLEAQGVKVTVFAVGQWLAANPVLGRRIVAAGHELANHTKTHQSMGSLSAAALATEIRGGAQALVPFIGPATAWYRPSGIVVPTVRILAEAGKAGYPYSIGYDVDTLDFTDPGATAVLANFQRGVQPGSIVSMHFGHQGTVAATPRIMQHLDSLGLRHVTLGELFTGA